MPKNILTITAVIGALATGFLAAFFFFPRIAIKEVERAPLKFVLPPGAIELTPCIPQHGAHWGLIQDHDPESDIQGPSYLLNEKKEVIGVEHHFRLDYLEKLGKQVGEQIRQFNAGEISISEVKVFDLLADFNLMGVPIKHADLDFKTPYGHPGYEMPHIDVHSYTISKEELSKVCLP